jgi:hypothetical protein
MKFQNNEKINEKLCVYEIPKDFYIKNNIKSCYTKFFAINNNEYSIIFSLSKFLY